jgi:type VI secretion system protein ImpH
MQAKKRQHESGLIARLFEQPQRFQFVQAVRLLVRWMARHGVPGDEALTHVLRFQNSLSLGFPASEIEALTIDARADGAGPPAAWRGQGPPPHITLTPAFFGLLGSGGALPFHQTERIAAFQWQEKDAGARAFLDLFSHRMVTLFYQAWGKYRLEHKLDTGAGDGLRPLLMALGGIRSEAFATRAGGVTDDVAAYYAALLRTRPVSAQTVARVLSDYFDAPIELEQFVGAWDEIPEHKRCTLGGPNFKLGYGAALGVRLWRHDLRVRINIGPLDKQGLQRFLPTGEAAVALAKMLALFGAPGLQYEVRLVLGEQCIEPFVLSARNPRRLGWNTFLPGAPGKTVKAEVRYMLHPS